jgi:hypothetical protein
VASLCFAKASLAFGEASSGCAVQTKTIEKERCGEVHFAHEREREKKPVRLELRRHKNLFDLTLTKNEEQILALEQRTMISL